MMQHELPDWLKNIFLLAAIIGVLILIAWIWSLLADGLSFEGALLWVADIIIVLIYFGSRQ